MWSVYLHAVLFAVWMAVFEESPWPTLTVVVSPEAIFLSTFVMIGQNRQAAFQQEKADTDYATVDQLMEENTRLTGLIHQLTREGHQVVTKPGGLWVCLRGPDRSSTVARSACRRHGPPPRKPATALVRRRGYL
jgi:uncharacterized membrane protein